jgi:hypothetical protein
MATVGKEASCAWNTKQVKVSAHGRCDASVGSALTWRVLTRESTLERAKNFSVDRPVSVYDVLEKLSVVRFSWLLWWLGLACSKSAEVRPAWPKTKIPEKRIETR